MNKLFFLNISPATYVKFLTFFVLNMQGFGSFTSAQGHGDEVDQIAGELMKWHKVTLTFSGPSASEEADTNPFLNYRMMVRFTNGDEIIDVPGYFAADGNAAETGATSGNKWRVHFSPPKEGQWNYEVFFHQGTEIAVDDDLNNGTEVADIHGITGSFLITSSDKDASHLLKKGRLQYVEQHYLQYADSKEYFIKVGPDSPENFLAYEDFDNTTDIGGLRKSWAPHEGDWNSGDPQWGDDKGREIIGALNYLAESGMNAFSFITMNIYGDDKNVYPYINYDDYSRFDCSKLDQWEIVFAHATQKSLLLHFKTQEQENDQLLNDGDLGALRKLYYRELIARFSHHPALEWNLGEENSQTTQQQKDMAAYIRKTDPYANNIVLHTFPIEIDEVYSPLLGYNSNLSGVSLQTRFSNVHQETGKWVLASSDAGKPWVVANDEQNPFQIGTPVDPDYPGYEEYGYNQHDIREKTLWGNLMAGGAGVMYYFGGNRIQSDMTAQDFRSRGNIWKYSRIAHDFFKQYLPFSEMQAGDHLVTEGWCFYKENEIYAIYLPDGGEVSISLPEGNYNVSWYNPREEGGLISSSVSKVAGGSDVSTGNPPFDENEDWAVLIEKANNNENIPPTAVISNETDTVYIPQTLTYYGNESEDPDGSIASYVWRVNDTPVGSNENLTYSFSATGTYKISLTVEDNEGKKDSTRIFVTAIENSDNCINAFTSKNGIIIIEAEATQILADWKVRENIKGYTGNGYISWEGESTDVPGAGILTYPVFIKDPGIYKIELRNAIGLGDDINKHNKSWLKVNGANAFYAKNSEGEIIFPQIDLNAQVSGDAGWFKIYNASDFGWAWLTHTNLNEPHDVFVEFSSSGPYELLLSAGESHHLIDRIVMYPIDKQIEAYNLKNYSIVCEDQGPPGYMAKFLIFNNNNDPVAGAVVHFGNQSAISDSSGKVVFSNIPPDDNIPLMVEVDNDLVLHKSYSLYGNITWRISAGITSVAELENEWQMFYDANSRTLNFNNLPKNTCFINVYDVNGRVVYNSKISSNSLILPDITSAFYFITLYNGNGQIQTAKFLNK